MVYLDNNATTPADPEVVDAMLPWLREKFGNPSAACAPGREARKAVETAREQAAALIGASPEEIIFTSCGTESDNTILQSALRLDPDRQEIVTTPVEHSAILKPAEALARRGAVIRHLSVSADGLADPSELERTLSDDTALVTVMWANNETGVIQDIPRLAEIAASKGCLMHTDAVQAAGKVPINVSAAPIHALSLSGHKLYCPKGIGALYIRKNTRFHPLLLGGSQEGGRRAGTEPVALVVAFGKACELARLRLEAEAERLRALRDRFEAAAVAMGAAVNGGGAPRLPGTSNISFEGADSEAVLILLDKAGVCCSAGSACTSGSLHPSHVIVGMGLGTARARSALRFSFGRFNTEADVDAALAALKAALERVRETAAARPGPGAFAGGPPLRAE